MALHKQGGQVNHVDVRQDRILAGTVGGEHITPRSVSSTRMSSVVDDADPRIIYAATTAGGADFTYSTTNILTQSATQTVLGGLNGNGTPYSAAQLHFNGTSIGVLGSANPNAGVMRVYIDGDETPGMVAITAALTPPSIIATPAVAAADLTITLVGAGASSIPAGGGTIAIGTERISYTSRTGNTLIGLTRGALGTIAQDHYLYETVYVWSSFIDTGTSTYTTKRLLYYNPFLSPGKHRITIVSETSSNTGKARVFLDGFVVGPLLGAANVFNQMDTVSLTVTTDANGHCNIGGLVTSSSSKSLISIFGYTQVGCETSNTTIMGKLGWNYTVDGTPSLYYHNGPVSSTFTVILSLGILGESV